jgi:hypothetical protein
MQIRKYTYLFLLLLVTFSCEEAGLYESGSEVSKEYIIKEEYAEIDFDNIFDVTLMSDTITKVVVTCGENIQNHVEIAVKSDNFLHIGSDIKSNWARDYKKVKIELHLNKGIRIDFNQPVKLSTKDTLKIPSLYLVNWAFVAEVDITIATNSFSLDVGSKDFGYYTINGTTDKSQYWIGGGSCYVRAENLVSKNCIATNRSMGDLYLNVTNQLNASLDFKGNIYYKGNPKEVILEHQYSSGKLIPFK